MSDSVIVRGVVATMPRNLKPEAGVPITSFRLVSRGSGPKQEHDSASDGDPNWYTVTAFDKLAVSAAVCVTRGDPLVVFGRLCVREWTGELPGVTVEIEAEAIGHDLAWGRRAVARSSPEYSAQRAECSGGQAQGEELLGGSPGARL